MWIKTILCLAIICTSAGCAFTPKKTAKPAAQVNQVKKQEDAPTQMVSIDALNKAKKESEQLKIALQRKDMKIAVLERDLEESQRGYRKAMNTRRQTTTVTRSAPTVRATSAYDPKKIQTALKASGYYSGAIDGKIGPNTKKAIMEFQEDHSLKMDGVVGSQTWRELKEYLEIK